MLELVSGQFEYCLDISMVSRIFKKYIRDFDLMRNMFPEMSSTHLFVILWSKRYLEFFLSARFLASVTAIQEISGFCTSGVMIIVILKIMIMIIMIMIIIIIPFGYHELKPWLGDHAVLPKVLELLTSWYLVLAYWYLEHSEPWNSIIIHYLLYISS